jgi:hypothetical protein
MEVQGVKVVFSAKRLRDAVCSSGVRTLEDLSPAQALSLGQVLGRLGTHGLQFGAGAATHLSVAVGALDGLLDGSPSDIQQGFYRHWLPGEQQAAPEEQQQVSGDA